MIRITGDTNIYVSALEYGGTPLRLLRLAADKKLEIAISQPILDELRYVLKTKFGRYDEHLDEIEEWIRGLTILVEPTQTLDVIKEDPSDNRIIECALESRYAYIVTGDKEFHRLGEYSGVKVMVVADLLDRVEGTGWRSPKRVS